MHQIRLPLYGAPPQIPLGELTMLPWHPAVFKGHTCKETGGKGARRERKGRRGKERGKVSRVPHLFNPTLTTGRQ